MFPAGCPCSVAQLGAQGWGELLEVAPWCRLQLWKEHQTRTVLGKLPSTLKSDVPWLAQTSHTDEEWARAFPHSILLGSWSYLHTTWSNRFASCFNWNSCPLKALLGTSPATPPHLVQLLYILSKDMARYSHSGHSKVGPSSSYQAVTSPYAAHFFSWYQRVAFMVLWALLFERFPDRVRDDPT